ncbi:hypothetical protein EJB05_12541, partial [Eragrostis curvula]
EPRCKLDIVCGVMEYSKSFRDPKVYHINFLVSRDTCEEDKHERTLFFAELWEASSSQDIGMKPSSCTPITDYFVHTDRCTICETKGSRIVHPPAGGHLGDIKGFVDLGQDRAPHAYNVGSKALREVDILYEDEMPETMPPPIRWSGLPEVQAGAISSPWRIL